MPKKISKFISTENYSFVFWILLVLSITTVYISISTDKIPRWHFYNSDALYLPMFYKDLFSDYSILGWRHPPAPYFFPDMPLYFIINFLVGNFHLAIMVYGVIQSLLFIISLIMLSNLVFGSKRSIHALLVLAGTVFFLFLATGEYSAFLPILQNGYHFGATLSLVFALLLVVQILRYKGNNKKAAFYTVLLFMLSVAMLLSDAIYLVQTLLPVMVSILVLLIFSIISAKQGLFVYAALIPSIPISTHLARMIFIFRSAQNRNSPTVEETLRNISGALMEIRDWAESYWCSQPLLTIFQGVWIMFVLGSFVILMLFVKRAIIQTTGTNKRRRFLVMVALFTLSLLTTGSFIFTEQGEWGIWIVFILIGLALVVLSIKEPTIPITEKDKNVEFLFLVSFFLFSIITNIGAILAVGGSSPRYFLPAMLFPLFFGWPFLIGGCKKVLNIIDNTYVMFALAAGTLFLSGAIGVLPDFQYITSLTRLTDYYPEFVECLDRNTKARNIHNGMSQYWRAKYVTMLSKNDLHVVQVRHGSEGLLVIDHLINNLNWYNTDFEFIITEDNPGDLRNIYEGAVISYFGSPADTFSCEGRKVLVYNREEDTAFQKQFKKYFSFEFYALQLPSETGRVMGLSRIADEESSKRGCVTYGPYVELPIGDYAFEIHYYAKKNETGKGVGKWEVVVYPANTSEFSVNNFEILKKENIEKEGNHVISGVFKIRGEVKTEIRTYYKGRGTLRVDKINISRIR